MGKSWLCAWVGAALLLGSCQTAHKNRPAAPVAPEPELSTLASLPLSVAPTAWIPLNIVDEEELLLSEVEILYQNGLDFYRRGRLSAARESFDRALTHFLQSRVDIASDERLSSAFEGLVEDVHALELASLENGDGMAPQKYESAPIEELAEQTFSDEPTPDAQIDERIRNLQSDLPVVPHRAVKRLITYFQGDGRPFIEKVLTRAGRYRPMIARILREEGMPQDLIYLSAAESGLNPFALSRAGAKGLWQFMPYEGRKYGLRIDSWLDERENPEKSTRAAAGYLRYLHEVTGDWLLAMAAYNGGIGRVRRGIRRTGRKSFWELYRRRLLPRETRNYVPIILATIVIAKEPWAYGFHVVPDDPLSFDEVPVGAPIDLRLVAQIVDRPVKELINANPGLLRWATPLNDPGYVLKLPPGDGDKFLEAVQRIPEKQRLWWRLHKVQDKDTISVVAKRYRISAATLTEANSLTPDAPLGLGTKLVLPLSPGQEVALRHGRTRLVRYRIRRGDSLGRIARRFRVSVRQIQRWNGIRGSRIIAGRRLRLYVPYSRSAGTRTRSAPVRSRGKGQLVRYRIRPGDSLSTIAERFKVSASQLRRWNGLRGSRIMAGRTLRVYLPSRGGTATSASRSASTSRNRANGPGRLVRYRVRRGDSLIGIAERFNVTVAQLRRWNRIRGSRIIAGRSLRVYMPSSGSSNQGISSQERKARAEAPSNGAVRLVRYRVQKGDTLWEIAQRFNVTPKQIQDWNGIRGSRINAGRSLRLHLPAYQASAGSSGNRNP